MATFQPPPTYAEVVLYEKNAQDEETLLRSARFNPIWLKWFVDIAKALPGGGASTGTVTAAAASFTGGIISISGSPITTSGTFQFVVAGTAQGIPYFTDATHWASTAAGTGVQVLHGAGPTWGPVALATDVSGVLPAANGGASAWAAFTPARTGWTDVGLPTVTGRFMTELNKVFFQVKVVPATSVATVAGTSYVALPATAAGLSGAATMTDLTTLISIGNCVIDVANSRVYVPSQAATADTLTIAGWYEK